MTGARVLGFLVACALAAGPALAATARDPLKFAADMARQGNWREARFRWEQLLPADPHEPRLLNNLAVAAEALGDTEQAATLYARALARSEDERIAENQRRMESARGAAATPAEPGPAPEPAPAAESKGKHKVVRAQVKLPVPPRFDLAGARSILVISFLTEESEMLDTNREMVRFLRSTLRKNTALEVPEISPPPAVPEQTVEDLLANREFWKHLGAEYGTDLILSGIARYERSDASRFEPVDVVSPTTGHKVRQTIFVEQEQFLFDVDLFFMDGKTGEPRFRDRLRQRIVFRGLHNDPITAFYGITEAIAEDFLAIVTPRTRLEPRYIFSTWFVENAR